MLLATNVQLPPISRFVLRYILKPLVTPLFVVAYHFKVPFVVNDRILNAEIMELGSVPA